MSSSMRCRITGCDLNDCGVCRRCGSVKNANHKWKDSERNKPCFQRKICERCGEERLSPDHQWEMSEAPATGAGIHGPDLKCGRCGLTI